MLTQNKDADKLILQNLDDKSLFNACLSNKYVSDLCKDEHFWRNRFLIRFAPSDELKKLAFSYQPKNMSWKNYYLSTLIEVEEMHNVLERLSSLTMASQKFSDDAVYLVTILSKYFIDKFGSVLDRKGRKGVENKLREMFSFNKNFQRNAAGEASIAIRRYIDGKSPMFPKKRVESRIGYFAKDMDVYIAGALDYVLLDFFETFEGMISSSDIINFIQNDVDYKLLFPLF